MYMIINGKGILTTIQVGGPLYWMDRDVLQLSVTVFGNKYLVVFADKGTVSANDLLGQKSSSCYSRLIRASECSHPLC